MKESLFEYYPPEPSGFKRLWTEGLIVLDANVLLNLYRLPTTARGEFLNVLELLKSRLWIPYQVALEFQRNRLSVITTERKFTEDALQAATNLVSALKQKVDALQIDKRGIGIEAQPLLDDLDRANEKLIEAIRSAHNSQLDVSSSDSVREKLDSILNSRVGPKPKDQADLDRLTAKGEERFKDRTPLVFPMPIRKKIQMRRRSFMTILSMNENLET
ncbi:MAG TPA: PIN-like domain-containing protein [Verrucomicrobiales bacterium]|nr:PIN-like domain-containing protein [Verrucomicrobiales bacterium]